MLPGLVVFIVCVCLIIFLVYKLITILFLVPCLDEPNCNYFLVIKNYFFIFGFDLFSSSQGSGHAELQHFQHPGGMCELVDPCVLLYCGSLMEIFVNFLVKLIVLIFFNFFGLSQFKSCVPGAVITRG